MSEEKNISFEEIFDRRENYGAIYSALGDTYFLQNNFQPALNAYTKAQIHYIRLLAEIFFKKGKTFFSSGDFKNAYEHFEQANSLMQDPAAKKLLAKAAIELAVNPGGEREPKCFALIAGMIRENQNDPENFRLFAEFCEKMGCAARGIQYRMHANQLELDSTQDQQRVADIRQEMADLQVNLQQLQRKNSGLPVIIFSSLTYGGVSAIEPILREILGEQFGYDLFASNHMTPYYQHFVDGPVALYHWTHDGPGCFTEMFGKPNTKFLYLYRDPRDCLVSRTKDYRTVKLHPELNETDLMKKAAEDMIPDLQHALEWMNVSDKICLKFNFDEMKRDIPEMLRKIASFLGITIDEELLAEKAHKYSFENVTGRKEGQEGKVVRGKYLFRKGFSGEWRNAFNDEIKQHFKDLCGKYVIKLGYEQNDNW